MVSSKYNCDFPLEVIQADINRLTNQMWKLLPMKENNENWLGQLESVTLEVSGLNQIFISQNNFLILLSKLEGLKSEDISFDLYRKTVFEAISLLRGLKF